MWFMQIDEFVIFTSHKTCKISGNRPTRFIVQYNMKRLFVTGGK